MIATRILENQWQQQQLQSTFWPLTKHNGRLFFCLFSFFLIVFLCRFDWPGNPSRRARTRVDADRFHIPRNSLRVDSCGQHARLRGDQRNVSFSAIDTVFAPLYCGTMCYFAAQYDFLRRSVVCCDAMSYFFFFLFWFCVCVSLSGSPLPPFCLFWKNRFFFF